MARSSVYNVVIADSCQTATYHAHLPADMKRNFGEAIPKGAVGVSWSGSGQSNLFYVPYGAGTDTSKVVCLIDHADGVIHAISPGYIIDDNAFQTTARNIVIHY